MGDVLRVCVLKILVLEEKVKRKGGRSVFPCGFDSCTLQIYHFDLQGGCFYTIDLSLSCVCILIMGDCRTL